MSKQQKNVKAVTPAKNKTTSIVAAKTKSSAKLQTTIRPTSQPRIGSSAPSSHGAGADVFNWLDGSWEDGEGGIPRLYTTHADSYHGGEALHDQRERQQSISKVKALVAGVGAVAAKIVENGLKDPMVGKVTRPDVNSGAERGYTNLGTFKSRGIPLAVGSSLSPGMPRTKQFMRAGMQYTHVTGTEFIQTVKIAKDILIPSEGFYLVRIPAQPGVMRRLRAIGAAYEQWGPISEGGKVVTPFEVVWHPLVDIKPGQVAIKFESDVDDVPETDYISFNNANSSVGNVWSPLAHKVPIAAIPLAPDTGKSAPSFFVRDTTVPKEILWKYDMGVFELAFFECPRDVVLGTIAINYALEFHTPTNEDHILAPAQFECAIFPKILDPETGFTGTNNDNMNSLSIQNPLCFNTIVGGSKQRFEWPNNRDISLSSNDAGGPNTTVLTFIREGTYTLEYWAEAASGLVDGLLLTALSGEVTEGTNPWHTTPNATSPGTFMANTGSRRLIYISKINVKLDPVTGACRLGLMLDLGANPVVTTNGCCGLMVRQLEPEVVQLLNLLKSSKVGPSNVSHEQRYALREPCMPRDYLRLAKAYATGERQYPVGTRLR